MIYFLLALLIYSMFYFKNNFTYAKNKVVCGATVKEYKKLYNGGKSAEIAWLAIIILVFFAGLRATTVGWDLKNYYFRSYKSVYYDPNLESGNSYEFLFKIINWLGVVIFGQRGIQFVLLVSAAIIVVMTALASKKMSANITTTMFLFVAVEIYFRGFDQIRQCIAISIFIYSIQFIIKKDIWRYMALILIAFMFHMSSVLFMFLYVLAYVRKPKANVIFYVITLTAVLLIGLFFSSFNELVKTVLHWFNINKFNVYLNDPNWGKGEITTIGICEVVSTIFIFLFFLGYKLYCKKKGIQLSSRYTIFLNIFYFAVLAHILTILTSRYYLFNRFIFMFYWAVIFLVPEFIESIKNKKLKIVANVLVVIVGLCFLYVSTFVVDTHGILPYKFFFEGKLW